MLHYHCSDAESNFKKLTSPGSLARLVSRVPGSRFHATLSVRLQLRTVYVCAYAYVSSLQC